MAKTELQRRLEALNDKIKNATPAHGYRDLPAGEYSCKIVSANIGMSKGNKENLPAPQIVWEYKIINGPCENRTCRRYIGLESESKDGVTGVDRLLGDLETLGIDLPEDSDGFGPALEQAVGKSVVIRARQVDERTFYDVIDVITNGNDEPDDAEEAELKSAPTKKNNDPLRGLSRAKLRDMSDKDVSKIAAVLEIESEDFDGNMKKVRAAICEELGL